MKKLFTLKTIVLLSISIVVMAAGTAVKYGSNPPASHTGSPGEKNCTACHSGSLNPTPANLVNLTLTTSFTGGGYLPDSTYTLTVKYTEGGKSRFGFQITALTKSGDNAVGTFTAGSTSSKTTGTILGKSREYLRHNGGAGSSSGKGEWTFTWKAPKTVQDTIVFYVIVNASNGDGTSNGDAIYAKNFEFGPSSLLPVASISANKTNICAGDTIEFMGSGTNNTTSYNWKFKAANPSTSTQQNPKIVFQIPGTYVDTLRVINSKGISAPATVKIVVNSAPVANIASVQPGNSICAGKEATLSATFGAGYKYEWNTGNPADTFSTVKVNKSGSYTVTVTNSAGCKKVSSATNIVVKPKLNVNIETANLKDTVCEGDTVTFVAQPASSFDDFTFIKNGNIEQVGSSSTYKITVAMGDTIEVIGTKDGCDTDPEKKVLVVQQRLAAPTVSCGNATTSSVTFNWSAVTGASGYEVSADSGKTWAAPSSGAMGTSHTVTGLNFNTNVQLRVRATDNAPCLTGNPTTFVCKTLSCSGITYDVAVADSLLCTGDSTQITFSNISAPKYSIRMGNSGNFTTNTVYWVKPTQTTDFDFQLIDSGSVNCPPLDVDVNVKVEVAPTITFTASPGTTFCAQAPYVLTVTPGFPLYRVYKNDIPTFQTNGSGVFNFISAGIFDNDRIKFEITSDNNCKYFSNEETFTVNPLPIPGFTSSINNQVVDFDDTTNTTMTRSWDFGDGSAPSTIKNPSHTYATVGNFDVKLIVTTGDGCTDSVTNTITTQNVSVGEIVGLSSLDIYPNPTKGMLKLNFEWLGEEDITLTVTDIAGKKIWSDVITENGKHTRSIDLSELADGTYLLQLSTAKGQHTLKVLKSE